MQRDAVYIFIEKQTVNALIVEDNLYTQQDLKKTFSHSDKTKFVLHFAQTGQMAKETLKDMAQEMRQSAHFQPTLILLDLFLPKELGSEASPNIGLDLCSWIKSHPDLKHIPVVFLSNSSEKDYQNEIVKSYACDFIQKPINEEQLFTKIDAILYNQSATIEKFRVQISEKHTKSKSTDSRPEILSFSEKVNIIIGENISDPQFNREVLAEKMGLSVRSLSSKLDIPPADYILKYKMNYSATLLEKGIKPKDVAALCGCKEQTFRRGFLKYKGLTPSQYQKQYNRCG